MPSMSETYAKTSEDGLAGTHHGGNHPRTGRYDDIPATSSSGDDGRNRAKMQESRRFDKEDRSPDIGETSSKIPKNVRIGRYDWKTLARDVKVEGAAASVVNRGENSTQANAQDRRRIYSGSPTIDIFETGLRVTKNVQSNKDDGKALSRNDKRIGREDRTIGSIRKSSRALSNSQLGEKDDSSKAETDRYDKIDIAVDEDTIRIRTVMLEGGRANRGDGGSASSAKSSPARESRQADRSDDRHVARPSRDGMTGTQAPRDDTGQWNGGRSSQSREAFRYNHVRPQNLSAAIRPPAPDSHIRWPQAAKY
ncbi:hypothetical protein IAR55_005943 [Kwoniella newhampshirensis]|uniref:Uncharacterized protein n=1 Tax=Kwoniella newhampshirensis TaxID=1651941 RepID=A0AAW0YVN6_9TREE